MVWLFCVGVFWFPEIETDWVIDDESWDMESCNPVNSLIQFPGKSDLKFLLRIWNCVGVLYLKELKFPAPFWYNNFYIRFMWTSWRVIRNAGMNVVIFEKRCRLRAWLLNLFLQSSQSKWMIKNGILILIKPRLLGVVVTLVKNLAKLNLIISSVRLESSVTLTREKMQPPNLAMFCYENTEVPVFYLF